MQYQIEGLVNSDFANRMWQALAMVESELLAWHLPAGTDCQSLSQHFSVQT
jgi:hypothetical protein